jgi:hypothetical protein
MSFQLRFGVWTSILVQNALAKKGTKSRFISPVHLASWFGVFRTFGDTAF